tara:strand:- start:2022 stop:2777 length:756 start_codon:yes stop_codon:yes gene_type:complete
MRKSEVSPIQKEFLQEIDSTSSFLGLMDSIDGLSFFAKDNNFRLIFANPYFYRRLGLHSEKEILGKNDFELFPEPLARKFRKDDEWVLTRAKPMTGLVELFLTQQGVPAWYQTNKFPIISRLGKTIGVMGTVQRYEKTGLELTKDRKIQGVMEQIRRDCRNAPKMSVVAKENGLSHRQLNRKFKVVTGLTPQQFLLRARIGKACEWLRESSRSLAAIGYDLGFCDQSAFSAQFRKRMQMTPRQYRLQYGKA